MSFKEFSDESYSVWSAAFETLTSSGVDARTANDEARKLLQQVLMAYGSLERMDE